MKKLKDLVPLKVKRFKRFLKDHLDRLEQTGEPVEFSRYGVKFVLRRKNPGQG